MFSTSLKQTDGKSKLQGRSSLTTGKNQLCILNISQEMTFVHNHNWQADILKPDSIPDLCSIVLSKFLNIFYDCFQLRFLKKRPNQLRHSPTSSQFQLKIIRNRKGILPRIRLGNSTNGTIPLRNLIYYGA